MITNYGFKITNSNDDWDINIDGLIKQVKEQSKPDKPKPKPKTRKKKI